MSSLYSKALGALLSYNFVGAERYFQRCIDESDHVGEAYFYLGVVALVNGDMVRVAEYLERHAFSPAVGDDFYSTLVTVLKVLGPVADEIRAVFRFTPIFPITVEPTFGP